MSHSFMVVSKEPLTTLAPPHAILVTLPLCPLIVRMGFKCLHKNKKKEINYKKKYINLFAYLNSQKLSWPFSSPDMMNGVLCDPNRNISVDFTGVLLVSTPKK